MAWTNIFMLSYVLVFNILLGAGVSASYTAVEVTVGRTALLPCTVDFSGSPQVIWLDPDSTPVTRNEETITTDPRFSVDRPYSNEWNLQIESVRDSDKGNYTCLINAVPVQRKHVGLVIISAPTITSTSPNTVRDVGSDVELECEAEGKPQPTISWHKYSFKGERTDLMLAGNRLMLTNVTRYDAAVYECEADNGVPPQATDTIRLDINFSPIVSLPHQHLSQEPGRDTFLQCTINANPHEDSHWEKDGVVLENSDKYTITEQDTERYNMSLFVFIKNLQGADFGEYECVAVNGFGRDSGVVELFEWQSGQARVVTPPADGISSHNVDTRINCTVDSMGQKDSITWGHNHPTLGYQQIFESHPSNALGESNHPHIALDTDKYEILGHYDLLVKNMSLDDSGEYICTLSGRKNYTASITVVDEMTCENNYGNSTHVAEGDLMDLSCSMSFAGPTRLWQTVWRHQQRKFSTIDEDDSVSMRRTISFPVFAKDSGIYTCLMSNSQPVYSAQCQMEVRVVGEEATPAPLCKAEPWDMATSTLAIIVASCVGGTTLVFIVVLLCVRNHYRKKICNEKQVNSTPNVYETNPGGQGNGAINMEARHLTADAMEEEV